MKLRRDLIDMAAEALEHRRERAAEAKQALVDYVHPDATAEGWYPSRTQTAKLLDEALETERAVGFAQLVLSQAQEDEGMAVDLDEDDEPGAAPLGNGRGEH